jgi:nitrate reductase NapE component
MISNRFKRVLGKGKTKEELDEHYKGMELEKGDFPAMIIAAIITFFPILIVAMVFIYGLMWILFTW